MEEKNISPEQDLIYRIVEQWGNVINMPKMEGWLKEYAATRQTGAVWVKASERVPVNRNLVHMNYNSQDTGLKTTGYYDPEKMTWHRQDGTLLDWHPNLKWLDESGTAAGREEDAVAFGEWLRTFDLLDKQYGHWVLESQVTTAKLYEFFKQQKEK